MDQATQSALAQVRTAIRILRCRSLSFERAYLCLTTQKEFQTFEFLMAKGFLQSLSKEQFNEIIGRLTPEESNRVIHVINEFKENSETAH